MTEPLQIGGVSYQAEQVKKYSSETKTRVDNSGNVSAFTTYHVEMNDGTKISYEAIPEDREASVFQENIAGSKTPTTKFFGLIHAEITDTPQNDFYRLVGCEFTEVNANRSKEGKTLKNGKTVYDNDIIKVDDRIMNDGSIQKAYNNKFHMDKSDELGLQDDKFAQPYNNKVIQSKARQIKDMKI